MVDIFCWFDIFCADVMAMASVAMILKNISEYWRLWMLNIDSVVSDGFYHDFYNILLLS